MALFVACTLAIPSALRAYAVGYTSGEFAVDPTGAATYRIPIQVPPGVRGLQPDLALLYHSRAGNGQLGMGWSLAGLSAITRCPRTRAQDGTVGGVNFDADDRFCLDGQRLVRIGGGRYGTIGSYRTEMESFQDVQAQGSAGSGPLQFVVRDKSGLRREYGTNADSRPPAANGTARMWLLSRITDRYGNFIRYSYGNAGGEASVAEISYGNSRGAVLARVTFNYQSRPDQLSRYAAGEEFVANQRLVQISTYAAGNKVKSYTLDYAQGHASGRSQLVSVTECASANDCLAPLGFGWQQNIPGFSENAEQSSLPASMPHLQIGDFDGDGIPDYLYLTRNIWYLRLGKNPGVAINTGLRIQNGDQPEYSLVADMNSDGCADLVTANNSRGWYVWHSNCDGTFRAAQQGNRPSYNSQDQQPLLVDLNGDGYPELVFKYTQGYLNRTVIAYYMNGPAGLASSITPTGLTVSRGQKLIPINFFGNGTTDLYVTRADDCNDMNRSNSNAGTQRPVPVSTSTGTCAQTEGVLIWNGNTLVHADLPATDVAYVKDPVFLDLNGDGLTDMLSPQCFSRCQWQVYVNHGGSWPWQTVTLAPASGPVSEEAIRYARAVDYNGDGLSDLMYPDANGRWSVLLSNGKTLGSRQETRLPTTGYTNTLFLDYHGNGWADMLYLDGRWQARTRGIGIMPDLMQRVSQGSGSETLIQHTISYLPLSDSTWRPIVYSGHSGNVSAPITRHFMGPLYVVRSFASHAGYNPSGSPVYVNSYYRYAGAKLDQQGRGFLGFAAVEAANTNTSIVTRTTYRQDFPFTGMLAQTLQFVSTQTPTGMAATDTQGPKICRLPNGEQDLCPEPPPRAANSILDNPPGRLVTQTDNESSDDIVPLGTHGESHLAYVRNSRMRDYDLVTGALYRETATGYTYDTHGNPTSVRVRTVNVAGSEAFEVQTTNGYAHDNVANWCLGLQSSSQTTRSFNNTQSTSYRVAEHDPDKCGLISETIEPKNPSLELVSSYGFDAFGNRTAVTLSGANIAARTSRTEFDAQGLFPVRHVNPLNHAESQSRDPAFGNPLSFRSPNGALVRWEYDGFGRKTGEAGPYPNQQTRWTRSWCAHNCRRSDAAYKVVTRGADGSSTETEYDALGRAVRNARLGPEINGNSRIIAGETHYDPLGRAYLVSRPYYAEAAVRCWTFSQYDNLNRLTRELQPANEKECTTGIPALSSPPAYSRLVEYQYSGFQTTETDPLGRSTTRLNNLLGKPVSVTDADGHATHYEYDPLGNPTRITDANGNVTRMGYDLAGRKTEMWDPDMGHWTYAYDALGQLLHQTDAKGQTLAQSYDLLGRLVQRTEAEGVTRWVYDVADGAGLGQLAYVARDDGYWEGYAYDGYGAPTDKVTIINNREYWVTTTYDGFGRVDLVAYPDINVLAVDNTPSGAPPALHMPTSSSGKFDITWDASANGAIYHLYRTPDQGVLPAPPANSREVYSGPRGLYHESLSEPDSYRYWLTLCYAQKCSAVYSTAAVAIGRPAAPGNFQVRADQGGDDGHYTASWNSVDGASSYKLLHSSSADLPGTQIYDGGTLSQPLILDDGSHYYQLQACAATGCSPFVKQAAGLRVLRTPGIPTISAPTSSANGRYNVSWSVPADTAHVKYYQLQESGNLSFAGATTSIETASATSHVVSHSAGESATYYYRVQACNQDSVTSACSAYSNTASVNVVAPPGDPVNFSVPASSNNGNFRISWDQGAGGTPDSYTVSTVVDVCEYDYETRRNACTRLPGGNSTTVSKPYADISGLKDGSYQYAVQACNASGCGRSVYAGTVVVKLLAGVPASLSVSPDTSNDGNYRLDWAKAEGPSVVYQLFEATVANFADQRQIHEGNELSRGITGKSPNGTYWYRVRACNSAGCSAYSNPVTVRVTVLPGLPSGLSPSVSTSTDGNYRLTWGTASGAPTHYQLFEATAADFSNQAQAYSGSSISWSINGKIPNAVYHYRVRACNEIGCGPYTGTVSVKVAVPPGVPINVSMPASSNTGNFRISWSAGTGSPPTSYRVDGATDQCEYDYETRRNICWRMPSGGSYTVSTPYVDINGLQEGTFYYSVHACDSTGCSSAASAGSIKVTLPPSAPASISASTSLTKTGNYSVSWGSASGSPTSYQLFESTSPNFGTANQVYGGSAFSWGIGGRTANAVYYYRARACNGSGCGPYTNPVSVEVAVTILPGDNGQCPPKVRVCQVMQPDGLVFAMPPSPELPVLMGVADPPQVAMPGTRNVRASPKAAVTGIEAALSETGQRIAALAKARQRFARAAINTSMNRLLSEYSPAPAVYQRGTSDRSPLRQDPRIQNRHQERNGDALPQFELAANNKPAATYAHMLQYSYDRTGRLSQLHEILPDNTVGTRYWAVADADAAGHITGEVFGNGTARAREFNAASSLQTGVNSGTRDSKLQDETYDWDSMGNLRTRRDGVTGLTESFGYDRLDRLSRVRTTAANVNAEVTAAYDAIGNIQNRDGVGRYAYGGSPHPHSQPHAVRALITPDSTKRNYSYDANGNLTSGPGRTVTWTSYNKPKTVNDVQFGYAPDGSLISRSGPNGSGSVYVGRLFEATTAPGGATEYKMYIYAGNDLVAIHTRSSDGKASTRYPLQDHLGSTVLLSDEQGHEVSGSRVGYDAWGKLRPVSGPNAYRVSAPELNAAALPGRPLGFTGHLNLDDLGLIHMGGRMYDLNLGRMLSADPNVQFPLSSQGFNRYSYVNNNPLSFTDPTGYLSLGQVAKIVVIAVISYYTAGWATNAWTTATASSSTAVAGTTATAGSTAAASGSAVATSSTTASLAAGGGTVGTSAATVTLSGQMIGGATGGFVGGTLSTGTLQGGLDGAFAGAVFGSIDFGYSGQWNLERVAVHTLAGGSIAKIEGGKFADGALFAGAGAALNLAYSKIVNYNAKWNPGAGTVEKMPGDLPVEGANNVGTDFHATPEHPVPTALQEGSRLSRALNIVPGINATAGPHDVWMAGIMRQMGGDTLAASVLNVPLMLPAAAISYGALLGNSPALIAYAGRQRTDE